VEEGGRRERRTEEEREVEEGDGEIET